VKPDIRKETLKRNEDKMNKVTSADCVAWIVANEEPTSQPKDWKRVSKRQATPAHIVRIFRHRQSGMEVTVHEWNGVIGKLSDMPESEKLKL
jgi:hypothetical protein